MEVGKMKHTTEQIEVLAFTPNEETKLDSAFINSRVVSENIIPCIVRSLKLLNEKDHHNHVLSLKDTDKNHSFGVLCGLATTMLSSYDTICIEVSPDRHLIIKGKPDRVGKFFEGCKP